MMTIQRDVNPENDKKLNEMLEAKFGGRSKTLVKGSTARILNTLLKRAVAARKQFEDRIFDPRRDAEVSKEVQEPADHGTLPGRDKTSQVTKRRKVSKHGDHDQRTHSPTGRAAIARERGKEPTQQYGEEVIIPKENVRRLRLENEAHNSMFREAVNTDSFRQWFYPKSPSSYTINREAEEVVSSGVSSGKSTEQILAEAKRRAEKWRTKVTKRVARKHLQGQHDQGDHAPKSRAPSKVRVRAAGRTVREAGEMISPRATRAAEGKLRQLGRKLNPKKLIPQIDSVLDDIDASSRIAQRLREIRDDLADLFRATFPPKQEKVTKAMLNAQLEKGIAHSLEVLTNAIRLIGEQEADHEISAADDKKLGELIGNINGMVGYLKDVKEQGFFEKAVEKHGTHDQSTHAPKGQRGWTSTDPIPRPPHVPEAIRDPKPGSREASERALNTVERIISQHHEAEGKEGSWHRVTSTRLEELERSRKRLKVELSRRKKVSKRTVDKHGTHDQKTHGGGTARTSTKQPKKLSYSRPAGKINSEVNRFAAIRAIKAGLTPKEVAREWPAIWQLDSAGKLGQKYDVEYSDGAKDTNRYITSDMVNAAIKRKKRKVTKGEPHVPDSGTMYRPSYTTPAVRRELERQGIKPNAKGRGISTARAPGY